MQYGIFDHLDHAGGDLHELYQMRLDLIEAYDAASFHAYHLAEHHGTPLGTAPSPSLFLAAAAGRSSRLRLGALVFCLPLYHPIRLLEEICMLDQLSNGRLELGVGRGISPIEGDFFDVDGAEAPAQYREALALILDGLKGGELSFDGDHYKVSEMPMVLTTKQRPYPPLWVGLGTPESTAWPAENAINIVTNQSARRVRAITDRYRQEWRDLGRAPEDLPYLGMTRHIVIDEDGGAAVAAARRAYEPWRAGFMRLWDRHGMKPPSVVLPDDFDDFAAAGQAIAGRPDEVAHRVRLQIEESGVNYFLCRFAFGDIRLAEATKSVTLFKSHIMDH